VTWNVPVKNLHFVLVQFILSTTMELIASLLGVLMRQASNYIRMYTWTREIDHKRSLNWDFRQVPLDTLASDTAWLILSREITMKAQAMFSVTVSPRFSFRLHRSIQQCIQQCSSCARDVRVGHLGEAFKQPWLRTPRGVFFFAM